MQDEPDYLTPLQRTYLERNPEARLAGNPQEAEPASDNAAFDCEPRLAGVGGWLLFLVISLTALRPLMTIARNHGVVLEAEHLYSKMINSAGWQNVFVLSWCMVALYCGISIFAGIILWMRHRKSTIPIVIACLWTAGPVLTLLSSLAFDAMSETNGASQDASLWLGPALLSAALWTAYLLRSRRVKNTYL